jgi:hypothetical protein
MATVTAWLVRVSTPYVRWRTMRAVRKAFRDDTAGDDYCGGCLAPFDPAIGDADYCSPSCRWADEVLDGPGVWRCDRCGLVSDELPDVHAADHLAGVHDDAEHGGEPTAYPDLADPLVVTFVDELADYVVPTPAGANQDRGRVSLNHLQGQPEGDF